MKQVNQVLMTNDYNAFSNIDGNRESVRINRVMDYTT